jgi:hypothetical protein
MFKGFSDSSRNKEFHGFPNLNFQMNNEAYNFSGCTFWLDAAYGLNTQTDLAAVTKWVDRIQNISFEQSTAANQPRLLVSDADFNNNPSIDFYSTARRMNATSGYGISLSIRNTYAFVYKKISNSTGTSGNRITPLMVNNPAATTAASIYGVFMSRTTSTEPIDSNTFGVGSNTSTFESSAGGDTNPHIAIVSGLNMVIDGVDVTPGVDWPGAGLATILQIGGNGAANVNSVFKIAEKIVFARNLSLNECIRLCNNLNTKYALY